MALGMKGRRGFLCGAAAGALALLAAGCRGSVRSEPLIEGTITYHGPVGITAADEIVLQIVDTNDLAAAPIADQRIQTDKQVPIPFSLAYDPAKLNLGGRYVIRAQIWREGRVLFATPKDVPIDPTRHITDLVLTLQPPTA